MTDPKPPTWCDVATLARAVATLTGDADLTHDMLVGLAAPIVRSMAVIVAVLETDPHGDSDGEAQITNDWILKCGPEAIRELVRQRDDLARQLSELRGEQ